MSTAHAALISSSNTAAEEPEGRHGVSSQVTMIPSPALPPADCGTLGILLDPFEPFSLPGKLGKMHLSYYMAVRIRYTDNPYVKLPTM